MHRLINAGTRWFYIKAVEPLLVSSLQKIMFSQALEVKHLALMAPFF